MFSDPTFIWLFLATGTSNVVGNTLLKLGITRLGGLDLSVNHLWPTFLKLVTNWQIVLGFGLYGLSAVFYLKLLSTNDVTRSYPAIVAYSAIVLLLIGSVFLKESITLPKIVGIFVILLGIVLISR